MSRDSQTDWLVFSLSQASACCRGYSKPARQYAEFEIDYYMAGKSVDEEALQRYRHVVLSSRDVACWEVFIQICGFWTNPVARLPLMGVVYVPLGGWGQITICSVHQQPLCRIRIRN
ncbi:hypothetical protein OH492_20115 [Vibrio chagasii]|nr:hypothetical protein [Vibrio chagasii]